MSTSDRNSSANVLAFPAGRRNVQWYNSRILSEDNFRRTFQAAIPSPAGNGTVILDYARDDDNQYSKLTKIAFLIRGYYIYLDNPEDETLTAINNAIGEPQGEVWDSIKQAYVEGNFEEYKPTTDFMEFDCYDENGYFYGLYHDPEDPGVDLQIPIIVPDGQGNGDINPAIDATENGDYYKPWFMSSATWAAGPHSDKNKIWVDDVYNVPHVCIQVGDKKRWLPLGAVYKTSRNGNSSSSTSNT